MSTVQGISSNFIGNGLELEDYWNLLICNNIFARADIGLKSQQVHVCS